MIYETVRSANPRFDFIKMGFIILESLGRAEAGTEDRMFEVLTAGEAVGMAVALREMGVCAGHAGRGEGPAWGEVYGAALARIGGDEGAELHGQIARYVAAGGLVTREKLESYSSLPSDSDPLFTLVLDGRHARPDAQPAERCCALALLLVCAHRIKHHTSHNYNEDMRGDFISALRKKCGLAVRRGYVQALYRDLEALAEPLGDEDEMRDD
jgi:hypothetical protein